MASILAPLLPTLAPATLILVGFLLLWQRMNHLQGSMNELRSDMKDGFERMERQLDKQQDLILDTGPDGSGQTLTDAQVALARPDPRFHRGSRWVRMNCPLLLLRPMQPPLEQGYYCTPPPQGKLPVVALLLKTRAASA